MSPPSALHRVKLGDASRAAGYAYEHMRNAANMITRTRLLTALGLALYWQVAKPLVNWWLMVVAQG